jgi:Uma2 family endonuclease
VFVRSDWLGILTRRAFEGVPDLIIECVAPDTAERDRTLKRERYAHFGVPEYWIVDAEARMVEIHRNGRGGSHVPEVVRDRWSWQPVPDGPVLELSLPELLVGYDELQAQFARDERRHVVLTSTNDRG